MTLFAKTSPAEKRARLRRDLESGRLLRYVGAMSPLAAMMIEKKGFEGVYISGAVLSADLGLPDIGLTTLPEVAGRGHQVARVTELPAVIDIDTGFGEPMNAVRAVRMLEDLGLAACHLEDQENPKRCGHLDNKTIVPARDMARKVKAAADARRDANFVIIARTDARASEGLDKAIDRAKAYVDAGADMIFPEAMMGEREFEQMRRAVDVPLLANMTEFGKGDLLSARQLENLGYNMVIYPVTTLRLAMGAISRALDVLREEGTQESLLDVMQTREELYALLRYEEYGVFDSGIYNFSLG